MPLVRTQSGGRRGGLLGSLFSRRGLGCPCNEGSQYVGLGQDFSAGTTVDTSYAGALIPTPALVPSTPSAQTYQIGTSAGNPVYVDPAQNMTVVAGPAALSTALKSLAANPSGFLTANPTLVLVGGLGLLGFFLFTRKKR